MKQIVIVAALSICATTSAQRLLFPHSSGQTHGLSVDKIEKVDVTNLKLTPTDGESHQLAIGQLLSMSNDDQVILSGLSTVKVVNPLAYEGVEVTVVSSSQIDINTDGTTPLHLTLDGIYGKTINVYAKGEVYLTLRDAQPKEVRSYKNSNWHFMMDKTSTLTFIGVPGNYTYSDPYPFLDIKNPENLKGVTPYLSTYNCKRLIKAGSNIAVGSWMTFKCGRTGDYNFNTTLLKRHKITEGINVIDIKAEKRSYIWIDAGANFKDFANSKANITRDLTMAADAGFTDIVVDVRSTTGDALFATDKVQQVTQLNAWVNGVYGPVYRTATWDYLQAFIDEGHKLGLRVHAAINTMVCGSRGLGIAYRDPDKRDWVTTLNTENGLMNQLDMESQPEIFFNPGHPEVQNFLCELLKDLASYKDLDGIFLDRGRYQGIQSDFSELSRKQFEEYIGTKLTSFPEQILPKGATAYSSTPYIKEWLEFRAKTIHDFMEKARAAVKSVNPDINFGVYVGGWYGSYYVYGVNWASPTFNPNDSYVWATENYKNYGFADHMDHMLIGAYANPLNVYGKNEWTIQGFCYRAMEKIGTACPIVVGGPDVGNWNMTNVTADQEIAAVRNSVDAAMSVCDGYFLFDMIHLKLKTAKWTAVINGFKDFINNLPKN